MKKYDPTVPVKNADGKDTYTVKTIGDLIALYHHLPEDRRAVLLKDTEIGLKKGAEALEKAKTKGSLLFGLVRLVLKNAPLTWVDDDKGEVTAGLKLTEDSQDYLWKKKL